MQTECKNSLHILLTSHYKLADMPQLLERTGSPPSSAHLSCQSSQSLLCATQITKTLLGHSVPSTSHSVLLVLAACFCRLTPSPILLLASCVFCSFAASLSCSTPPSDLIAGHFFPTNCSTDVSPIDFSTVRNSSLHNSSSLGALRALPPPVTHLPLPLSSRCLIPSSSEAHIPNGVKDPINLFLTTGSFFH